jgi:metal-sulfur cluster biosynthetic enzyme
MDTTLHTPSGDRPEAGSPTVDSTVLPLPTGTHTANDTADGDAHQTAAGSSSIVGDAVSEDQVKLALRRVKDPDLNLNIVDLGLVYGFRVDGLAVHVDVTLTSPACPSGPEIIAGIEREVRELPGVEDVQVNLIWTPFWTPDRIEPRVRAYLGL